MDIEGAFDKVDRRTLFNALSFPDVPSDVHALLQNWHRETPYIHKDENHEVKVDATTGVRQGCVAAPMMWTAFTHTIFFVLSLVFSEEWVLKHLTLFADDLHASWEFISEQELELALLQFRVMIDVLTMTGININTEKSVVLSHFRETRASKWHSKLLRKSGNRFQFRLPVRQSGEDVFWFPATKDGCQLFVVELVVVT